MFAVNPILSLKRSTASCGLILTFFFSSLVAPSPLLATEESKSPPGIYDQLHEILRTNQPEGPLDNLTGSIVWGSSYQLDSYVDMFQATGDAKYLEYFVALADRVLAARADKTGTLDYRGRLTYGWPSDGHYTLGKPTALEDREGNPSLEVRTIARSHNNKLSLEIVTDETEGTFDILVTDARNPDAPNKTEYKGLTLETIEAKVNPKPGERGLVRVRVLGEKPPRDYHAFTPPTELMTFHGHHTGRIVTSFARFCALILKEGGPQEFREKAEEYLAEMRVTMVEHDQFFIEEEDWGYTIFEKGSPFWCDGAPEVHNTMAASGSAYLNLYRATGESYYLDRATRLARLFGKHHIEQPNDTWSMNYWWGLMHEGWRAEDGVSENLPVYAGSSTPDDISHFQLTLTFLMDCYENGVVFTENDLRKWANTFHRVLYRESEGGPFVAYRLDGSQGGQEPGEGNHVLYGYIELGAKFDEEVAKKCRGIFYRRNADKALPSALIGWAALAKAEAGR
jgi:hypothetical protein